MHWSHTPLHHWQDDKWLAQMRRELPANQYLRMIENRFTSSEAAFITMGKWDPCVRPELGHGARLDLFRDVFVGVDAATASRLQYLRGVVRPQHADGAAMHPSHLPADSR